MAKNKKEVVTDRIKKTVEKYYNKDFKMYFFIADSQNIANSEMYYIYNLAGALKNKGFNVKFVYQLENEYTEEDLINVENGNIVYDKEREFIGAKDWLNGKFEDIEKINISKGEWSLAPEDFVFLPEAFSGMMFELFKNKVPSKVIVIANNKNNITKFIPFGKEWGDYGINTAIVSTKELKKYIEDIFPYMNVKIIEQPILDEFEDNGEPKELIINMLIPNQDHINRIIKQFYWKYPIYKFVTFRDLRNFSQKDYIEKLKEGAISIWVDEDTTSGLRAIESIKAGNILIGKYPNTKLEWMYNKEGQIIDNAIWVNDIDKIATTLKIVIENWLKNNVPNELMKNIQETTKKYNFDNFIKQVDEVIDLVCSERGSELDNFLAKYKKEEVDNNGKKD